MKKSRFTEEQIAYALATGYGGPPVADECRQIGISERPSTRGEEVCRSLRQRTAPAQVLEDENARASSPT